MAPQHEKSTAATLRSKNKTKIVHVSYRSEANRINPRNCFCPQGRTFAAIIKSYLQLSEPLNDVFLPMYDTEKGSKYLNAVRCQLQNA